jgi:hypothetical protein
VKLSHSSSFPYSFKRLQQVAVRLNVLHNRSGDPTALHVKTCCLFLVFTTALNSKLAVSFLCSQLRRTANCSLLARNVQCTVSECKRDVSFKARLLTVLCLRKYISFSAKGHSIFTLQLSDTLRISNTGLIPITCLKH